MCKFVTHKQIENWLMRLRNIILSMMACVAIASSAQPVMNQQEWEWYLGEVVNDVFVGRNYFEYYYTPSAADMEQQRSKGEVTYFLNTPEGLNSKKVRDMIDRLMASYDDIKAVCDWQMTTTTYWKEFRFEKNKFRFSVKRKALDDGTYYVSVTETAGYYKTLGKSTKGNTDAVKEEPATSKSSKRSTRSRRTITQQDVEEADKDDVTTSALSEEEEAPAPVVSEKERRRAAREREQALEQEQRLAKRRAQEQQREEAKKQKEAEKQKKAEEKKKKEEEKRLAQEKKKQEREQAKQEREQAKQEREQAAERKKASSHKTIQSKYHYNDIALWLSEKYDFTQTAGSDNSCTMFSTAVKDVEMAKLAIKNALKGSNARMAVPWRLNSETQAIETGYTVDDQVLVFTISKDADERITITVTEIENDDFEQFKQSLNGN